ncbi:LacI family DNA-binding transcriptional regulator [Naasia sp. SYSU D00057]|uniref:LacI family DNA-binding transcriptional regulator n=1 Tax=Naasia sp. SYSU D00057 TaxID=2817380 RepID=UPI001B30D663|nr:LacI family DNA-binding transcriptional regulator [Naasia sp. SYSU D00057]
MKAPTIYDVARRAGVSHQTVSRYLHGFAGIRPETRERVQSALDELEYRPNSAARLLRSRRVNRIGVLAHRLDHAGPSRIIAGATAAARRLGFVLDIAAVSGDDPEAVDEALAILLEHQVAGVIATAQTEAVIASLSSRALALPLLIDNRMVGAGDTVSVNERAGRLAARHLLGLGHRRVGYLSGPASWMASQDRRDGFAREIAEGGGEVTWIREGDWSAASGSAAWAGLGSGERSVSAIATANDSMAIGLISALEEAGRRVPDDMSVIGTDDMPEARYLLPSLSTVAIDFEGEGTFIVEALAGRIGGAATGAPPALALPELRARRSTAGV